MSEPTEEEDAIDDAIDDAQWEDHELRRREVAAVRTAAHLVFMSNGITHGSIVHSPCIAAVQLQSVYGPSPGEAIAALADVIGFDNNDVDCTVAMRALERLLHRGFDIDAITNRARDNVARFNRNRDRARARRAAKE